MTRGTWPDPIVKSFGSTSPAAGFTHDFYRYPARFSPEFVRSAINELTCPGDVVFDPFMGAGTTAVEALAAGRKFIGCDLNPLATFVATVKTTPLDSRDINAVRNWGNTLRDKVNLHTSSSSECHGYAYNLPWTLRKTFEMALGTIATLRSKKQQAFARCTLLRAGQWALDCRSTVPSVAEFFEKHANFLELMMLGLRQFESAANQRFSRTPEILQSREILNASAETVDMHFRKSAPHLILTSPPYLGVHILYHRWQVHGRRETPAPFWLAGCNDGHGASYYTFASRRTKQPTQYLDRLSSCLDSIHQLMSQETLLVQVVAFSNAKEHLPLYLERAENAGFVECSSRRPERIVPNRKWYADVKGVFSATREILLVHKKKKSDSPQRRPHAGI